MSSSEWSIVGRSEQLAALRRVALREEPVVVGVVDGPAGIGKSTVWSALVQEAKAAGSRTLTSRPAATEAQLPYVALSDLLQPVSGALSDLAPPQRRALAIALRLEDSEGPLEPAALSMGVVSLLGALAADAPLILAVDDWQWLDPASASVLAFAVRRLERSVGVLATVRTGEHDHGLGSVIQAIGPDRAVRVRLGPLAPADVRGLAHAHTGRWLSPPDADELHRRSGGNPLIALELLRATDSATGADAGTLLTARFGALDTDVRAVLRATAVLSAPSEASIEALLGAAKTARRGLELGLSAGVLTRVGPRIRPFHPLLASVVEERTSARAWRALHARAAGLATEPQQRARHLGIATEQPSEPVASELEEAAAHARRQGAPVIAARLAQRATELTPPTSPRDLVRRALAAADAWALANALDRADAHLRRVTTTLSPGPLRAETIARRATFSERVELPELRQALDEAGDDEHASAEVYLALAMLCVVRGHAADAFDYANRAVEHASRSTDARLESQALVELGFQRFTRGEGVQRKALLKARELQQRSEPSRLEAFSPLAVLGMQLYMTGDADAGRRLLEDDAAQAGALGDLWRQDWAIFKLAELETRAGRLDVAQEHARTFRERWLAAEVSNEDTSARWIHGHVQAHRGDVELARMDLEWTLADARRRGDRLFGAYARHSMGFLELSRGNTAAAVQWLWPLWADAERLGLGEPGVLTIEPDLAEALVATGALEHALEVARSLERLPPRPWITGMARRCHGLVATAQGRTDDAITAHSAALDALACTDEPFERGRTLLHLGVAQRRAKRRAAARESFAAALATFEDVGSQLWVAKARQELARISGRRPRSHDGLTDTEHRIAELAISGRSNREIAAELFVTERTVEANLTRAYRKLEIRGRTQLAGRLRAE